MTVLNPFGTAPNSAVLPAGSAAFGSAPRSSSTLTAANVSFSSSALDTRPYADSTLTPRRVAPPAPTLAAAARAPPQTTRGARQKGRRAPLRWNRRIGARRDKRPLDVDVGKLRREQ